MGSFRKLYMKELMNKEPPKTIKELIDILYFSFNKNFPKSVITYSNKDCTTLHCEENRGRSFDDLLRLCQTYIPGSTPEQLMHELLFYKVNFKADSWDYITHKTKKIDKYYYFMLGCCHDINKIRIYFHQSLPNISLLDRYDRNYNEIKSIGKLRYSIYTWEELLNMLGIIDQKTMNNYNNKYENIITEEVKINKSKRSIKTLNIK